MEAEVMAMRMRLMTLVALILVSACGRVADATPTGNYRLYEAAARPDAPMVALIDTRSRAAHDQLPLGTPSSDWKHYYAVRSGSLLDIDPETGTTTMRVGLPGDYMLPPATNSGIPGGLSQNGRWLVLQRFDRQAQTLPSKSHFLMFDTSGMDVRRSIDLDGYFQFDAISNDGERLFLIQYINSSDYHVRVYSVGGGALDPNFVVDKNDGGDAMNGLKLTGVASHDGQWLFSVYARTHQGAFIHALNLIAGSTGIIWLDAITLAQKRHALESWTVRSLALSPDGATLYAVNDAGAVAELSMAGGLVTTTFGPNIAHPIALMRVEALA